MLFTFTPALLFALSHAPFFANAAPAQLHPATPRALSDILPVVDEVVIFDTLAFLDPADNTFKAPLRTFVHLAQFDLSPLTGAFTSILKGLGVEVGNSINILEDRIKLFAAIGLPGKRPDINIAGAGCAGDKIELGSTQLLPDLGMAETIISIGECGAGLTGDAATASVDLPFFDDRTFAGSIFPSIPDGFGVISDVDDTIKISNVLDKPALLKSTFLEDTKTVPGMPELYAELKTQLNNPAFVYLSGSPFQLFPTLKKFVSDSYPAGPVILQNLTLIDVPGLIEFVSGDTSTLDYKVGQMQKIQTEFPAKKFLAIGDSTQQDPEAYAKIFNEFGADFMTCIWIRKVAAADNSATRFATAFAGIDPARVRTFDDPAEMASVNVAGGEC